MDADTGQTPGLTGALWALAAVQATIGLVQIVAPGWFYDQIANFGQRSDHTLRDVATYYLASAIALAAAAKRPSWRAPVLLLVLLQYVFHAVNHLADIGDADPSWVGPADAITLIAVSGLLLWCLRAARRDEGAGQ